MHLPPQKKNKNMPKSEFRKILTENTILENQNETTQTQQNQLSNPVLMYLNVFSNWCYI